jgi:Family of unknown function (DUF6283)
MTEVRKRPCAACPFRLDCPPAVWDAAEYAKLPPYDAPTAEQPVTGFACHASPATYCHGWAVVGSRMPAGRALLALRIHAAITGQAVTIPDSTVPLHESGAAAAEAGLREAEARTWITVDKLLTAHERLREGLRDEVY